LVDTDDTRCLFTRCQEYINTNEKENTSE